MLNKTSSSTVSLTAVTNNQDLLLSESKKRATPTILITPVIRYTYVIVKMILYLLCNIFKSITKNQITKILFFCYSTCNSKKNETAWHLLFSNWNSKKEINKDFGHLVFGQLLNWYRSSLVLLVGHLLLKGSKTLSWSPRGRFWSQKMRPFFSFLFVSDYMVHPDPKFLIYGSE